MADPAKEAPVDPSEPSLESELGAEYAAEIRRRLAQVDAGEAEFIPADEVFKGMRALIEKHRKRE